MQGTKVDKNMPFYMGFYKYKDLGSDALPPEAKQPPARPTKTLSSLDFGQLVSKHRCLQRTSIHRQTFDRQDPPPTSTNSRRSVFFEEPERRTLGQSTGPLRRSVVPPGQTDPRLSLHSSQLQSLTAFFGKRFIVPDDESCHDPLLMTLQSNGDFQNGKRFM